MIAAALLRRAIPVALTIAALAAIAWLMLLAKAMRPGVVVRNASGTDVAELRVLVTAYGGSPMLVDESGVRLAPGEEFRCDFPRADASTQLTWTSDGRERQFEEPYVDLWAGERRRYDLGPDGTVATKSEFGDRTEADLRLVGTVTAIGFRRPPDPVHRWVVTVRVERVLAGSFDGDTFSFVVHSPSQERLREGGRYVIEADRTSGSEFRFVAARAAE